MTTASDDLTPRQREVLDLLNAGKQTGEIATALGISSQGVSGHIKRLKTKGLVADDAGEPNGRPARSGRRERVEARIDPDAAIMAAVEAVRLQRAELEARLGSIDAEREALTQEEEAVRDAIERLNAMLPAAEAA